MLRNLFLSAAVAALAFTACDSDSSTSPNGFGGTSTNASCSVKQTSANSLVMTVTEDGATTTLTSVLSGNKVENSYVSVYDASVSAEMIQKVCEENMQEAMSKGNATVLCDGRTIAITETVDTDMSFEQILATAKSSCGEVSPAENPSDQEPANGTPVSTHLDRATCQVTENAETVFKMTIYEPDTGTVYISVVYGGGVSKYRAEIAFDKDVPKDFIETACAEAQAEAYGVQYDGTQKDAICGEYSVMTETTYEYDLNLVSMVAEELTQMCDEIRVTGKVPDADEEF